MPHRTVLLSSMAAYAVSLALPAIRVGFFRHDHLTGWECLTLTGDFLELGIGNVLVALCWIFAWRGSKWSLPLAALSVASAIYVFASSREDLRFMLPGSWLWLASMSLAFATGLIVWNAPVGLKRSRKRQPLSGVGSA